MSIVVVILLVSLCATAVYALAANYLNPCTADVDCANANLACKWVSGPLDTKVKQCGYDDQNGKTEACTLHGQCLSGHCNKINSVCKNPEAASNAIADGDACSDVAGAHDFGCVTGSRCSVVTANGRTECCGRLEPFGEPCTNHGACCSGNCDAGFCAEPPVTPAPVTPAPTPPTPAPTTAPVPPVTPGPTPGPVPPPTPAPSRQPSPGPTPPPSPGPTPAPVVAPTFNPTAPPTQAPTVTPPAVGIRSFQQCNDDDNQALPENQCLQEGGKPRVCKTVGPLFDDGQQWFERCCPDTLLALDEACQEHNDCCSQHCNAATSLCDSPVATPHEPFEQCQVAGVLEPCQVGYKCIQSAGVFECHKFGQKATGERCGIHNSCASDNCVITAEGGSCL